VDIKKNKVRVFLVVILIAVLSYVVIFILPAVNELQEERELHEDDFHVEAFVIGEGSEKGVVKVGIVVNNSKNKVTRVPVLKIYNKYTRKTLYISSKIEVDQDKKRFYTDFEVPKNQIYIIKIEVENSWNREIKYVTLNTW